MSSVEGHDPWIAWRVGRHKALMPAPHPRWATVQGLRVSVHTYLVYNE
eukprot:COSAG02_NODE_24872_length_675_cov_1.227431_1_plen_47_part_01